jgi:hypothetical protein
MGGELPADLRAFLVEFISSVVQLEALLLLRRSGTEWTAEALPRELRIEPQPAVEQLGDLCHRGLVQCSEAPTRFRYAPRDAEQDAVVGRLEQAYDDRRVSVIGVIYSTPRPSVRVFAEAFRFRKDENDG